MKTVETQRSDLFGNKCILFSCSLLFTLIFDLFQKQLLQADGEHTLMQH